MSMPGMNNMQFGSPGNYGPVPPAAGFQQDFSRQWVFINW